MAMKRVITGVHIVPMRMANAFLIEDDDGFTLVDAGSPVRRQPSLARSASLAVRQANLNT
jgi:hypothetical protein